jgi:hypothetical protein
MTGCTLFLLSLGLLFAPTRGKAEETYTIKSKESTKGQKGEFHEHSTQKTMMKLEDSQGNVVHENNETVVENYAYQETILEKPDNNKKPPSCDGPMK